MKGEPEATVLMFRFLASMVAVRIGTLREVRRGELRGRRVVVLASVQDGAQYAVDDPQLGAHEAAAVNGMLAALGG